MITLKFNIKILIPKVVRGASASSAGTHKFVLWMHSRSPNWPKKLKYTTKWGWVVALSCFSEITRLFVLCLYEFSTLLHCFLLYTTRLGTPQYEILALPPQASPQQVSTQTHTHTHTHTFDLLTVEK